MILHHKFLSQLFKNTVLPIMVIIAAVCCSAESINASSNNGAGAKTMKIVALGDSTTEADWEDNAKEVYASRLQRALQSHGIDAEVINAGISNTTSRQALARLDSDVRRHKPDVVIVQFGINDSWIDASLGATEPRLTLQEYRHCLTAIIDTLRGDGARVILMTSNPMRWSEYYGKELRDPALGFDFNDVRGINRLLDIYVEEVRDIAKQKNVALIDVFARFEAYGQVDDQSIHDLLIPEDEMHPNDLGHTMIAQWLADLLLAKLPQP